MKTIKANNKVRRIDGWKRQHPDHRDFKFKVESKKKLPSSVDLRAMCPRVEDQGELGSCTANATTSAMEFLYRKAGRHQPELSRLFCYFASRVWIEGTKPDDDSGCMIRDVIKAVKRFGVPPETLWPYDTSKFNRTPTEPAQVAAFKLEVRGYLAVNGLNETKACLAAGYPVVIGFSVPENMESDECASNGIVYFPDKYESLVGGHAVLLVGYNDQDSMFTFQNSWGAGWGDHGYGYLPYQFVAEGLASDFWTIRSESM